MMPTWDMIADLERENRKLSYQRSKWQRKVRLIQDTLSDAIQNDMENGVKWLNEFAAEDFDKKYPAISRAFREIMEINAD